MDESAWKDLQVQGYYRWVFRLCGKNHQPFSDAFFLKVAQTHTDNKDDHWWQFLTKHITAHPNANYVTTVRTLMEQNSYRPSIVQP